MAGRFSLSVPGRRGPSDPWFRIGTLDVTTTVLVVILCVAGFFVYAFDTALLRPLVLIPDEVRRGQLWRVATWPIPNSPDIWTVIMFAVFWYFGSELERLVGRVKFAVLLGLLIVIPGIVAGAVLDGPQFGLRTVELCVFVLFVVEYPFARFFFGIPAWVLAAVIVGLDVIQLLGGGDSEGLLFLFVSFAVAALVARSMGLAANLAWIPALGAPTGGRSGGRSQRRQRNSSGTRGGKGGGDVVAGPWAAPSRPAGGPLPQPPNVDTQTAADQAELDDLLDKISSVGMDGLSSDEKRHLNELSQRLRNRR